MKTKKMLSMLMVVLLMGAVLAGCFNSQQTTTDNEPKVLRILGYEWTVNELSSLFEVSRDNVTVELIDLDKLMNEKRQEMQNESEGTTEPMPWPQLDVYEVIREAMTGPNAPDVVYLDMDTLPKLANEGLLLPLETYIADEDFPIDKIAAAVKEGITDLGGGTLYALAPTFTASALFYNKDFFTERGIAFPTDGMTWDQVFNLARDLTHEENGVKKYGITLGYGYLNEQINIYGSSLGINRFDEDFTTFTVDTPEMEKVWGTIVELNKEGIIAPMYDWSQNQGDVYIPYQEDDFISGRAAMKIGHFSDMRSLSDIFSGANYWGPDVQMPEPFEWDVVTLPTHPEAPGVGGQIYLSNMMGINANAENPDVAWDYISFINGDRVAKVLAKNSWELPARTDFAQAPNGLDVNLNAFTALKPVPYNTDNDIYQKFPYGGYWEFYNIEYQLLEEVKNGTKSVQEALAEFQTRGQELLDQLNQQIEDGTYSEGPINVMPIPRGDINVDVDVIVDEPVENVPAEEPEEGTEG